MPTDLGEGPIPEWLQEVIEKEKSSKAKQDQKQQQQQQQQQQKAAAQKGMTMDQKVTALKTWAANTIKDTLRPRIGQFRGDVSASPRMASILDICYGIKNFKAELDKLSEHITFTATPPQSIPPGSSTLEILRAVALAALNYIDSALETITEKLPSLGADKITVVMLIVQVVNSFKAAIA